MSGSRLPAVSAAMLAVGLLAIGCDRKERDDGAVEEQEPNSPLTTSPAAPSLRAGHTLFERLPSATTGVSFVNPLDLTHPMKFLYHQGLACGGVAIGDLDGDDRPDLYLVGGPVGNKLYRQVGDFKFEDVTAEAKVDGGDAWGSSASMVDIDNDGDLDLYVCNYDAPNQLYLNESTPGKPAFTEAAARFGLALVDASMTAAFSDYDRDGDLDLFLLTNRFIHPGGLPEKQPVEVVNGKTQLIPSYEKYYLMRWVTPTRFQIGPVARSDRLLRNDGGIFAEVSAQAGITAPGEGLSVTWWDYNEDGWPDIYVGNDFQDSDHLYRNNRDGTFTDVLDAVVPHTSWFSMGADMADLNNDGLIDFLTADMSATTHFMQKTTMGSMSRFRDFLENARPRQYMRNALYLNSGTGRFMEAAYLAGLADTDWTWSVKLADFDNDGWVDGYFTNGMSRSFNESDRSVPAERRIGNTEWDLYESAPPRREQNLAFRNQSELRFEDVSAEWGLDHTGMSFASAYADLDRDGDLDLVTANLEEEIAIYRNNTSGGHHLQVKLAGQSSNRFGFGARVELELGDGATLVRIVDPMTGFKSSNEPIVHFGLGERTAIARLTVRWPSGVVQTMENPEADRIHTLTEPAGNSNPSRGTARATQTDAMFARASGFAAVPHVETPYDDYQRQPLLPHKLSQLGPGMAWGDVDGDGDHDLYLCGAAGTSGQLLINHGDGTFKPTKWNTAPVNRVEELGALLFDADRDGDRDLYIVSGGVEHPAHNALYRDRLYLNDGKGSFTEAPDALPAVRDSGGAIAAADFDRDGDLDLFVGGRVIPGVYPLTPESRLLVNESTSGGEVKFRDATDQLAPGLRHAGLVTGGLWSDADGDGFLDLLITREWGSVMLFHYDAQSGQFTDRTEGSGLEVRSGWGNGIAGRGLDNDGDLDYVVTNFGLNTKYHASVEKPALLYYGDFEGTGRSCLVEAEFENDTLFPIRGKSCSIHAMPGLGDKFKTYREFAQASLQELYTPASLKKSLRLAADTLQSGIFLNDGKGTFSFAALPHLAQIAPSFGVALSDVDGDRNCDILLAQNFFSPQPETGRMDGGLGLLLLGEGGEGATFRAVWPNLSGIVIPNDGKSLTIADLNGDAWPDVVVGVNNGLAVALENQPGRESRKMLRVRLTGQPGNLAAVGSRVSLTSADGTVQTAEVHAGSGYLSQAAPDLFFGLGTDGGAGARLEVRWPDGTISKMKDVPAEGGTLTIRQ